jgi:hypothetical protein
MTRRRLRDDVRLDNGKPVHGTGFSHPRGGVLRDLLIVSKDDIRPMGVMAREVIPALTKL